MAMKSWHPEAKRIRLPDAGSFLGGGKKIVYHTTEGSSVDGAVSALRAANAASHFVINPHGKRTELVQLIPLHLAARSLAHPSGPETNRANAIQIEIVGFSAEAHDWSDRTYENLRGLTRWIHRAFGVPLRCDVTFKASGARRLSGSDFFEYEGLIGHQHVPGNDHTDPGDFRVGKILEDR